MSRFVIAKIVGSLPETLSSDTVYLVRTGAGFDLYCSDTTGSVAHKVNSSGDVSWSEIDGKPSVIAAGSTKDAARESIGITVSDTEPSTPSVGDLWIH